ncbi:hypothetical protein R3P38DRAFT_2662491 [Favolaschia claudopus]|uniref:Uncharacterized protein n=1 Tax=Favolaschia claudopus TaxID=2862362 RepID=A0AAV9ZJ12_9AGAR
MPPLTLAYYCSGHGYGHATRVSAMATHLLHIPESNRPVVHIVSSAPKLVFADSISLGAHYRNANIDPVIVQPLAYRVDRQQSLAVLKSFLDKKNAILEIEIQWLTEIQADCVLSDAAFIGCLAATAVGIPSILVTNFTFDSVYSYLATTLIDAPESHAEGSHSHFNALVPDIPLSPAELEPLVDQIFLGYRCADMLLRLPGYIPIPSFAINPSLPSPIWVDTHSNRFHNVVFDALDESPSLSSIHPSLEYQTVSRPKPTPRQIVPTPLLVRSPSSSIHSPCGRSRLLDSIGVPSNLHDPNSTKILIVSFGGQVFKRPSSRSGSATASRCASRELTPVHGLSRPGSPQNVAERHPHHNLPPSAKGLAFPHLEIPAGVASFSEQDHHSFTAPRLATASHLWIPGAPPASKPPTSPTLRRASVDDGATKLAARPRSQATRQPQTYSFLLVHGPLLGMSLFII